MVGVFAGAALGWLPSRIAAASTYPAKPVKFVVGQAPGGPSDRIARLVAAEFEKRWNEAVIVINHPGATGTIAGRMVARGPADGYTLLVASNGPIASAPVEVEDAGYDPLHDWAPVGRIARGDYALVVRSGLGVGTVREFVALARARPERLSISTVGPGSNSAQALALFQRVADIKIIEVPYNGGGLALEAVVAGHVDGNFCDVALAQLHAAAGTVKILAVCSTRRTSRAPELPTFAEAGFPGVVTEAWYGIVAPARTPPVIIDELVSTLHAILGDTEMRRRLTAVGCETIIETPEQFAEAIRVDVEQAQSFKERGAR